MTEKELLRKIEGILEAFDFDMVHQVMEFLDWKWANDEGDYTLPSTYGLIKQARKMLKEVGEKYLYNGESHSVLNGGFCAVIDNEGDLCLSFVLDEVTTY